MKFSYLIAILYTAICPGLYDEVYNYNFIYNHHSDSVKIEFTFPLMEAEFTEFDVDLVNRIIPLDAAVADILAPILLPIDAGLAQVALNERYSFYYCGKLDLLESVESHLIYMTCHDIKNCYLFLVNTQNKYVLSSVLLSQRFFYSNPSMVISMLNCMKTLFLRLKALFLLTMFLLMMFQKKSCLFGFV